MSTAPTLDYETVFRIVHGWTPEQRIIFLQDVLRTLVPAVAPMPNNGATLEHARGLLVSARPVPTDDEIVQMLNERRTERYGL
jgi:hypothetical protein